MAISSELSLEMIGYGGEEIVRMRLRKGITSKLSFVPTLRVTSPDALLSLVLAQQLQQDEEDAFHRREAAREERPPPNQRPPPSTRPAPPRPLPNTEQERARKLKQKKDKCVIS